MFLTILIAFFSIIALFIIHEFGHFIVAKRFGIEVEEFGVGLPPRLFGKKIGGTLYSLNLLPFGAFVKIPSVEGGEEDKSSSSATEALAEVKKRTKFSSPSAATRVGEEDKSSSSPTEALAEVKKRTKFSSPFAATRVGEEDKSSSSPFAATRVGEEDLLREGSEFKNIPIWQKALIILAGVVSFWLVGVILLSVVFSLGTFQVISDEEPGPLVDPKVQIVAVAPGSPAETADIKVGDTIALLELKMKNEKLKITKVKEVQDFTEINKGEEVVLTIERGKEIFEVSLVPRISPPESEGAMGVALVRTAEKSYPIFQAFIKGVETTINLTQAIVVGLADVLVSLIKGKGLPPGVQFMGPIGIGSLVAQAVKVGLSYFLQFIAIISIYLAIFNLLPIPALDGGRLLFLGIEKIKGSPVNQKIEQNITAGFFIFFIALMIWVTIKDISRLF